MNHKELLKLIEATVPDCTCQHAGEHIYKLAAAVLEKQKDDDAALAELYSQEAADAIRGA
jgi:hypothetical protein